MGLFLSYDLLESQPDGTFLICPGQEVLIKNDGAWCIYQRGHRGRYRMEISLRTIGQVLAHRVWSLS